MSAVEAGDYEAAGIAGKGGMVVGVIWAENALSLVLIGMRSYTRRYIRGKLGWDDVCLWITWVRCHSHSSLFQGFKRLTCTTQVLMAVFGILITIAGVHGMGQHFDDLELRQFSTAVLYLLCSQFIVSLAIGVAKVVVAVFLLRIINAAWFVTLTARHSPPPPGRTTLIQYFNCDQAEMVPMVLHHIHDDPELLSQRRRLRAMLPCSVDLGPDLRRRTSVPYQPHYRCFCFVL